MKKIIFLTVLSGIVALAACRHRETPRVPAIATRQAIWFHPMTAHADRAGAVSSVLQLQNNDTFGAGLIITASATVFDADLEWVSVDLPLPVFNAEGLPWKIDSVEVCYDVSATAPGKTFISQVRLTEMTTPNFATVQHDDGTDLSSTTPTCYGSNVADVPINGAFALNLRIAIDNPADRIRIGAIRVFLKT